MKKLCICLCLLLVLTGCGGIKKGTAEKTGPAITAAPSSPVPTAVPTPAETAAPATPAERQVSVAFAPAPTMTPLSTPSPSPVPTFTVGGETVRADEETLVLTQKSELELLGYFPSLRQADCSAFTLDPDTAYRVRTAHPDTRFVFTLEAYGLTVTDDMTYLDLRGVKIESLNTVDEIAACMPNLTKVDVRGCGYSNEELGALSERHPGIRFVWEVELKGRKLRTDAVGFSTLNPGKYAGEGASESYRQKVRTAKRLYTADIQVLRYCPDLIALDLGHNYIDDLSVLEYLPNLQILIVADNKLTDISPLEKLPNLVYVEFFMNAVTDISPLADHPLLLDLNFCNNKVTDLSPLTTMPQLERVWCAGNKFSRADGKALQEQMPGCIVDYTAKDDTADGWREHERYEWMRAYMKGEHNPE